MKGGGGRAAGTGTAPASKCTVRTLRSCHLPQITTRPSLGNHLSGPRPAPGPQEIWPDLRPPTYKQRSPEGCSPARARAQARPPPGRADRPLANGPRATSEGPGAGAALSSRSEARRGSARGSPPELTSPEPRAQPRGPGAPGASR